MKKKNLLIELRKLSPSELKTRARDTADELMKLRFRRVASQLDQTHRLRELRRDLARILTLVRAGDKGAARQ